MREYLLHLFRLYLSYMKVALWGMLSGAILFLLYAAIRTNQIRQEVVMLAAAAVVALLGSWLMAAGLSYCAERLLWWSKTNRYDAERLKHEKLELERLRSEIEKLELEIEREGSDDQAAQDGSKKKYSVSALDKFERRKRELLISFLEPSIDLLRLLGLRVFRKLSATTTGGDPLSSTEEKIERQEVAR
jgi:hypothetical protein